MTRKLYVGNLSYSSTEEGINNLFSQYGTVTSVTLIQDRHSGRPKGFGFVEFETDEAAEKALAMNGQEFEGRPLKVNIAKPREEGGGGSGGRRGGGRGGFGGGHGGGHGGGGRSW